MWALCFGSFLGEAQVERRITHRSFGRNGSAVSVRCFRVQSFGRRRKRRLEGEPANPCASSI
jgi:hypothetical protein